MIKGIAASPGIRIGRAFVLEALRISINTEEVKEADIGMQIKLFDKAVELSKCQLIELKNKVSREFGEDKSEIIGAHLMIMDDTAFMEEIINKISNNRITADNAVSKVSKNYIDMFENMEDEYLRERAADIKDICQRLVKNILGVSVKTLEDINEEVIVVAKDLTPSDTAQMDKSKVVAFATDMGGKTSHTAIMARSLEIPAVIGLMDISQRVKNGDILIIDGNTGVVHINPAEDRIFEYNRLIQDYRNKCEKLKQLKNLSATTADGIRTVMLSANIGTPDDVKGALENGAEGVGLYRTEFLYMNRNNLPTEADQFEAYKKVAQSMIPHPVIIRTLDIGGDKGLAYLDMPNELNPFLGYRAIRFCLGNPDIFKTQLRAILKASNYGNIKIMYPMISSVSEVLQANKILGEAKQELKDEGIPFNYDIEVGIMIEIPSAAIIADLLVKEVDFFSIGTNDLIQYTSAVDRMNEHVSYLYEPFHPAVLRLIKNVIDASHREGKWTGICGEMAGDELTTPILLGMGLDEFSMSAPSISKVKNVIRSLTFEDAKKMAESVLRMNTADEIKNLVFFSPHIQD